MGSNFLWQSFWKCLYSTLDRLGVNFCLEVNYIQNLEVMEPTVFQLQMLTLKSLVSFLFPVDYSWPNITLTNLWRYCFGDMLLLYNIVRCPGDVAQRGPFPRVAIQFLPWKPILWGLFLCYFFDHFFPSAFSVLFLILKGGDLSSVVKTRNSRLLDLLNSLIFLLNSYCPSLFCSLSGVHSTFVFRSFCHQFCFCCHF